MDIKVKNKIDDVQIFTLPNIKFTGQVRQLDRQINNDKIRYLHSTHKYHLSTPRT